MQVSSRENLDNPTEPCYNGMNGLRSPGTKLMKIPFLENLSDAEKKTLKLVAGGSLAASVGVVGLVWIVGFLSVGSRASGYTGNAGSVEKIYEEKSDDLLEIDIQAHLLASQHFATTNQPGKAANHLLRIIPAQPDNRALRCDLATAYLREKRYDEAMTLFRQLAGKKTDSLSSLIDARYGLALYYLGNVQESLQHLQNALGRYPRSSEVLCYLGQVEAALSVPSPDAEKHFQKAIQIDPEYIEARYQQARYFMQCHQYLQCRDSLLAILDREPLHVRTHSRLGMVYYYLNQPDMAEKSYRTALALNPNDFNTHYNLGELLYTFRSDRRKALEQFREAVTLAPDHPEANFKIGLICLNNDLLKEAALHLRRAQQNDPENIRILLQLAVAFERLESRNKALDVYQRIRLIDPLNRIANQKIASLQIRAGG